MTMMGVTASFQNYNLSAAPQ